MKHYVVYHNIAKRGRVPVRKDGEPFAILTDRPVAGAMGARVWLISGSGSPATFHLHYAFTADFEESAEDEGFAHRLGGSEGVRLRPPVTLNNEPWFADLKATQFFSRGLCPVTQEDVIHGLLNLAPAEETGLVKASGALTYPDELNPAGAFREGSVVQVLVNRYERDPIARAQCLALYGHVCCVCECDFSERYGEIGRDFIHVHHLTPISKIGRDYEIRPEHDLVPVCPNCHAMLHRKDPPFTIQELTVIYSG